MRHSPSQSIPQRICVVGPLPPPSGGMAAQCDQLVRLLRLEGLTVELVQSNKAYWPHWVGGFPLVRAAFRMVPYLMRLWQATGQTDVVHVLANSGWSWHLFAAPAVVIARLRTVPVIVHYHGGNADMFFSSAPKYVLKMLKGVSLMVMPSAFLCRIFSKHGLAAEVIPNVIDLSRFKSAQATTFGRTPHLVVTRNLEPIYDIATAIRAFARIRQSFSTAQLTIAGSGPDRARLQKMVADLGLLSSVRFSGRIDNAGIHQLYASATCLINPSTVDNTPVSILEAFASGVPVVSTCAGGVPDMLQDGVSGLLVPIGDDAAMAQAVLRVLRSPALAASLRQAAFTEVEKCAWNKVGAQWLDAYGRVTALEATR